MKLKRVKAAVSDCEGCFFYRSNAKKGEDLCSKYVTPDYAHIDCVEDEVADPNQFGYYIFKEIHNEEQNETMAP